MYRAQPVILRFRPVPLLRYVWRSRSVGTRWGETHQPGASSHVAKFGTFARSHSSALTSPSLHLSVGLLCPCLRANLELQALWRAHGFDQGSAVKQLAGSGWGQIISGTVRHCCLDSQFSFTIFSPFPSMRGDHQLCVRTASVSVTLYSLCYLSLTFASSLIIDNC